MGVLVREPGIYPGGAGGVSASQTLRILGPSRRFRVLSLRAVVVWVSVTECAWGGSPDQGGNLLDEGESVLETIVRVFSHTALAL